MAFFGWSSREDDDARKEKGMTGMGSGSERARVRVGLHERKGRAAGPCRRRDGPGVMYFAQSFFEINNSFSILENT